MQVSAEAVAEKNSPNIATHSPAGLFEAQKKTGLLPSFAQVFAENSISMAAGVPVSEDGADLDGTAANSTEPVQGSPALRELLHGSPSGELLNEITSAVEVQVGGDQSAFQSTKSKSKAVGHRGVSQAHSGTEEKKKQFGSAQTEPTTLAVSFPVFSLPIHPATAPALKAGTLGKANSPTASSVSAPAISIAQVWKDEHFMGKDLGQDNRPTFPGESFQSADDVFTSDAQRTHIVAHVSAEPQFSTASVVLPEAAVSASSNSNESRTSPMHAYEVGKAESVPKAVETLEQRADIGEMATAISKLKKTPDKTSEPQPGGTSVPLRSPLMETVRVSDTTPVSAALPGTEAVANPARQEQAQPETNTFQHLDSGQTPATMLLHSNSHQIVVGMHDPSLGWLEVQTQSSAGHINATLTAATAEAHTHLAAQAPAITQYLADRQVFVHSLNVHTQADAQSGASSGGQPHTGTGNARKQESSEEKISEVRPIKAASVGGEVSVGHASDASYISVHA